MGKSSLLNALTGRRALARVSTEPGRTRQLNFFDLADRLTLVDMPGYGYARAGRAVKQDWQGLMFDYLRGRPTLRRVMLLLDARIEMKEADTEVMELLDRAAVTFQLVLTKVGRGEAGGAGAQACRSDGAGAAASGGASRGVRHQQRDGCRGSPNCARRLRCWPWVVIALVRVHADRSRWVSLRSTHPTPLPMRRSSRFVGWVERSDTHHGGTRYRLA